MSSEGSTAALVVVDDDADVLTAARFVLATHFKEVRCLRSPESLPDTLAKHPAEAVLLDMNFAKGERDGTQGLSWLARLQQIDPTLAVVLMTAYGDVPVAVESLKRGAVDFVLKPWQNEKLVATLSSAAALTRARREALLLKMRDESLAAHADASSGELIGSAPALRSILEILARAAPTDANIMILGESGTGKELTAREIHRRSRRAAGPFISVDLGAIPENLFESVLFGHRKGAFTGADRDRAGHFQAAQGGTLFLDEIGNLPLHMQSKLLTVIESRQVLPVGSVHPTPVDVRLITATNRSAADLRREEVFRQDLLFRIHTVEIVLPPLRERQEDIPLLLEHFLGLYARKHNTQRRRLSPAALKLLENYEWPGNVRELRHAIERASILCKGERLELADFPFASAPKDVISGEHFDLERIERQTIERALKRYEGNISLAAAALGITRASLYRRLSKHGL